MLLFDLLGEVYFYGWVWCKIKMVILLFGVVKDVMIFLVLVGNVVMFIFIGFVWFYIYNLDIGVMGQVIVAVIGVVMFVFVLIILFGNWLFSLMKG